MTARPCWAYWHQSRNKSRPLIYTTRTPFGRVLGRCSEPLGGASLWWLPLLAATLLEIPRGWAQQTADHVSRESIILMPRMDVISTQDQLLANSGERKRDRARSLGRDAAAFGERSLAKYTGAAHP